MKRRVRLIEDRAEPADQTELLPRFVWGVEPEIAMDNKIQQVVALEGPRTPLFLPIPMQSAKEYSDETARVIDAEVKQILEQAHDKVREILASHRPALEELASLLLKKEVVERPELQAILKVRSIDRAKERKKAPEVKESEQAQTNRPKDKRLLLAENSEIKAGRWIGWRK